MKSLLCGAGAPARERLEAKADKRKASAILAAIAPVFRVLIATLREIFDEAAYQRFLARGQMTSSPAAYDDFLREGEIAKARRPRCC
jgi:hypothetical protein